MVSYYKENFAWPGNMSIYFYVYLLLERYARERQGYSIDKVESEWKIYYYVYTYFVFCIKQHVSVVGAQNENRQTHELFPLTVNGKNPVYFTI